MVIVLCGISVAQVASCQVAQVKLYDLENGCELELMTRNCLRPLPSQSYCYFWRYSVPRRLTLNLTSKVKLHNLEPGCEASTFDEESFENTFVAIGLLRKALERSPSFDLEFDLEGQVAHP